MAALGGALLLGSFFLPLISASGRAQVDRELFGVDDLRAQIEASRDLQAVQPLLEPALQELERFTATPSLRNLSGVMVASGELLEVAAGLGPPEAEEMRRAAKLMGLVRTGLWLLPLVGAVQLVAPLLTLLRGYAGFFGLVARFLFGLIFVAIAFIPLVSVPEAERDMIGPALWVLLAGALLMMAASVLGVTRRNWWGVLLADVALVIGAGGAIVGLAEALKRGG